MALYRYQAKTPEGETKAGTIEAASLELAVSSLQRRGLVIIALEPAEGRMSWWQQAAVSFERVKSRDIVVLSRQFATLFEAKVPVVQALRVLIDETSNQTLKKHLSEVLSDIQGGISVSSAMSKHPQAFSNFYVNMVRSGEESGKLEEIFGYLPGLHSLGFHRHHYADAGRGHPPAFLHFVGDRPGSSHLHEDCDRFFKFFARVRSFFDSAFGGRRDFFVALDQDCVRTPGRIALFD